MKWKCNLCKCCYSTVRMKKQYIQPAGRGTGHNIPVFLCKPCFRQSVAKEKEKLIEYNKSKED